MTLVPLALLNGDLGDLLSLALAVVAISTLAGYGLLRGNVQNLRDQLKDEREARESLTGRFTEMKTENTDLRGKVKVLEGIVTGEVHWVALGSQLDHHHQEAKEYWTAAASRDEAQQGVLFEILSELRSHPG